MGKYAERTSVSVEKSRSEIEQVLDRYGADAFRYSRREGLAMIEFTAQNRLIRFTLPLPLRDEFAETPTGKPRAANVALKAWEQACRQRWRALCLAIKAKLEAVESGIAQFEQEFLAYVVDPATNRTISEVILPQIEKSYASGEPKQLLLDGPRG